jgi:hypothetical protein
MTKVMFSLNGKEYIQYDCIGIWFNLSGKYSDGSKREQNGIWDINTLLGTFQNTNYCVLPNDTCDFYKIDLTKLLKRIYNLKGKIKNTSGYGYVSGKIDNKDCKFEFNILKS